MAAELEARIAASTEFSLMAPRVLSLINFRYAPDGIAAPEALDALNERLLNAVNDDGFTYLTQNRVHGRYVIRFQIGHTSTAQKHVTEAWERIEAIAATL
jgi:aromatic-L-amino-acid decarboxylase